MIPLVATKKEFDILKAMIDRVAAEVARETGHRRSTTWSAP